MADYYYRARYYDPEIGRFISEDPLGFQAGMNFYAYVGNNPINNNDPTGKEVFAINAGIGGTFAPFGGLGAKGAVSGMIAFDTNTLELALIRQRELGVGFASTRAPVGGLFLNGVVSNEAATINDLLGPGVSLSGSLPAAGRRSINGAVSIPFNDFIDPLRIKGLQKDPSQRAKFFEAGFSPLSTPGAEFGATLTFGEKVGSTTIIKDIAEGASSIFNGVANFFSGGSSSSSAAASGGFVLYPSKPNTNQLQSVYQK